MPSKTFGDRARLSRVQIIGRERRSQGAAGVAGGRLNPDIPKRAVAQDLAVGDAIKRNAAGKAEIFHAGIGGKTAGQPQNDLLQYHLDRGGEVHVLLR